MSKRHEFKADDYFDFILEMKGAWCWNGSAVELYKDFFNRGMEWGAGKFKPEPQFLRWLEKRKKRPSGLF
jgi:hypothetical protein